MTTYYTSKKQCRFYSYHVSKTLSNNLIRKLYYEKYIYKQKTFRKPQIHFKLKYF